MPNRRLVFYRCCRWSKRPVSGPYRKTPKGLLGYCTSQNAYLIAKLGRKIKPVCSAAQAKALAQAYAVGMRHYEIGEYIWAAHNDISEIDTALRETGHHPSYKNQQRMNRLRDERTRIQSQIRHQLRSRLLYATWPLPNR